MQYFATAEGYARFTTAGVASAPGINTTLTYPEHYSYVYSYKDHLGNVRMNYAIEPGTGYLKIIEENHYYPFGLKHANYNTDLLDFVYENDNMYLYSTIERLPYKYKYNGKEWQDELGLNFYDYGARNYDPAIGRWMNIDPLAETSRRFNPYTYALNNPICFIDPDGMQADDWKKTADGSYVYDKELTKENASEKLEKGETYVGERAVITSGYGRNADGSIKDVTTQHSLNSDGSVTDMVDIEDVGTNTVIFIETGDMIYVNDDVDNTENVASVAKVKEEVNNMNKQINVLDRKVDSLQRDIDRGYENNKPTMLGGTRDEPGAAGNLAVEGQQIADRQEQRDTHLTNKARINKNVKQVKQMLRR
ncbi:MAG TPA: RHS repeat-associated core domain-containing protein [Flavobacterium sp.]|jgi:RHS repeat-associated protein